MATSETTLFVTVPLDSLPTSEPSSSDPLVMRVAYGIIGTVGILSNGLVIYVLIRVSQTRQVINMFIINQSLIDMFTSLMLILCYVLPVVQFPSPTLSESFGRFVCVFWYSKYPCWGSIIASTANLVCLTMERYMAVISPLRYQKLFRWPRSVWLAILPWLVGYTYQTYWIFMHTIDPDTGKCGIRTSKEVQIAAGVTAFVTQYFFPLSLMTFVYIRIAKSLNHRVEPMVSGESSRPVSTLSPSQVGNAWEPVSNDRVPTMLPNFRGRARRNVIKTLVLVCVAFFVCWTPNQVCYLIFNTAQDIDKKSPMFRLTIILAFCNMIVNPFIYAFKYRVFRHGLLEIVPCLRLALQSTADTSIRLEVPNQRSVMVRTDDSRVSKTVKSK
ncbi:beta-2 adrenergic receptor-like [Patiria miniata]|uniref:G-protein coupled receptors family 1 profile domain-containing protein n=1 Tax=Patiria miniata TaxID=46514 RepID=A0A914AGH7_PATMI|nr:beta-2 adrenergic receptor-like [Patiria miniata]